MSVSAFIPKKPLTPQERRDVVRARFAELASKVDELTDAEIEAAHNALLDLEIERLWKRMCDGAQQDMDEGKLDPVEIDKAIKEFRARHPYR